MSGAPASASNSPSSHDITNEEVKAFFNSSSSSSESDVDLCGPHDDCCGGAVRDGVYTRCAKRLGKPGLQHRRGIVCRSLHTFFQCATCQNVVHSGCWVRTAKGSFVLPSASVPFHCCPCDLIKGLPFDPMTVVAKVKQILSHPMTNTVDLVTVVPTHKQALQKKQHHVHRKRLKTNECSCPKPS